jgi:hypothetical protein
MRALATVGLAACMLAACTTAQADKESGDASQATQAQSAATPASPAGGSSAVARPGPPEKAIGSTGVAATAVAAADEDREITIPAGTILHLTLETPVGSDTSRVEQPVHAALRTPIVVHGVEVLSSGTAVNGHVTAARRPGKVKGRGYIAMRFTNVDTPGEGTTKIRTAAVGHLAPATKEKDTLKIIAPAAGAAVLGRVVGGKGAARKGAVIGGAAGTGYVLSTRGEEARLGKGARLTVRLTAPVTVRIRK